MRKEILVLLPLLALTACAPSGIQYVVPQAAQPVQEESRTSAGPQDPARQCASSSRVRPVWWGDGVVSAHIGCATAHNASQQDVALEPEVVNGGDGIIAVSGVLRYRKGQVRELRAPTLGAGGEEGN